MAVRTISTKIAVDGEAEFKQAITNCNSQLSLLKSSLAATESEFRNNANSLDALRAKDEKLNELKESQKQKTEKLKEALENCRKAVSQYAEQYADLDTKLKASNQALSELDSASKKAGDRWADYSEEIRKSENALKNLNRSSGDTSAKQKELEASIAKAREEMGKLEASTDGAAKQAGTLILENRKLNESFSENAAKLDAATRGANNWEKQLNTATIEANRLDDAIKQNNQYLKEAETSADGCARSIDQYGKAVKDAGDASEDFRNQAKDAIEQLASAIAAAGIVKGVNEIKDALLDCSEASKQFDISIAKISTISDTANISMDEIRSKILAASGDANEHAADVAEAVYQAISSGIKTANAVESVGKSARLAVGGFTSVGTSVDVLTTALNAYKLESSESEKISDILITTPKKGKTTVDELGQSVGKVIPLAAAYNVQMDNLGTSYAVLTSNGIATAEAGTYLKSMISELGNSSSETAQILRERTGRSFAELTADGQSLGDVLSILGDSVDGSSTAFKELWSSTEAGVGALSLFNSGAEHFNSVLGEIRNSTGATETAYRKMSKEFAANRMEIAAENLEIAIGSHLNPALDELRASGADAFTWAADFVDKNPWVVSAISGVTASLGALSVGVAALSVAPQIITALKLSLDLLAKNPIVTVVAAIAGLSVAIGTWAAAEREANEEAQALENSIGKLNQRMEEIEGNYQDASTKTMAAASAAEQLAAKLESLERQEAMTEGETALYAQAVDKLRTLLPDVNFEIDEQTGKLKGGAAAVRDLTEAWKEQALAQAMQDKYQAVLTAQADALVAAAEKQLAYNDALATYTDVERQIAECEAEIDRVVSDSALTDDERFQRLGELTDLQTGLTAQYFDANNALQEQKAALESANEAAQAFDEEIQRLSEVNALLTEGTGLSAESYTVMESRMESLIAATKELEAAYQESYFDAYESISQQVGLFEKLDGTATTSINNLIEALKSQVIYMESYAENIQKAMEMGVDQGLIRKLSDGSEESAQILASIVQGGEEDIAELNKQLAKVEEGKENFSKTVAEMETDFNNKMDNLVKDLDKAIQEMNLKEDAYQIGFNNMQGLINGTASQKQALVRKYAEMGRAALDAYKREVQQQSPSKAFYQASSFDIQGIIKGAESEKGELGTAYADLARTALERMDTFLPSTQLAFRPLGRDRQTDAIVSALSRLETGNGGSAGQSGISSADLAAAFREALDGMSVQLDGRRMGKLVSDWQNNDNKAWGR